ncbi:hypothetical protein SAMN00790413_03939 [Deinococcus hopiensis KR-140]|uniref:Uncharacterized protein n=1 Tax=Deinococcus hopiensis KR-140 TaxID=695939 RepID=A0A1W1U9R7_9DEIO|nr:hypothetical protein SAMN00790413_03939 [Deinococcus hopiensis KR-140]
MSDDKDAAAQSEGEPRILPPLPPLLSDEERARIHAEELQRKRTLAQSRADERARASKEKLEASIARNTAIREKCAEEAAQRRQLDQERRAQFTVQDRRREDVVVRVILIALVLAGAWALRGFLPRFGQGKPSNAASTEATPVVPPDPPRNATLAVQPADLIREECLNNLRTKVEAPSASYDPENLPAFADGRWSWHSSVGEFLNGAEVQRRFTCSVQGETLDTATVQTSLR